jgi:hypothetical protein
MPRARNAKPPEKTPARAPAARKPVAKAAAKPAAKADSGRKRGGQPARARGLDLRHRRMTLLEHVHLAMRLAAARHAPKPVAWATLAKREGVSVNTCKEVLASYEREVAKLGDASGMPVLEETLALYEGMLTQLSRDAVLAERAAERVGAIRQLGEVLDRRLYLLTALGRMPRSFRAQDEMARLNEVITKLVEIVERRGIPDLVEELLELVREMQRPVIDGHAREIEPGG